MKIQLTILFCLWAMATLAADSVAQEKSDKARLKLNHRKVTLKPAGTIKSKATPKPAAKLNISDQAKNANRKVTLKPNNPVQSGSSLKATNKNASPKRMTLKSNGSSVITRMQRTETGQLKKSQLSEMKAKNANRKFTLKPNSAVQSGSAPKPINKSATPKRMTLKSNGSSVITRMQRSATGQLKTSKLSELKKSAAQTKRFGGKFETPKLSQSATTKRPNTTSKKLNLSSTKRFGGKFETPKLSQGATTTRPSTTSKKLNLSSTKRFGGKFETPKLSQGATTKRPSTTSKKLNLSSTKRFGGKFSSPKTLLGSASKSRPMTKVPGKVTVKPKYKSSGKTLGKAAGGLAAIGIVGSATKNQKSSKQLYQSGKITKKQYQKDKLKNATNVAGELYKLKKLNPSAILLNDVVGTDPISLGVDAVGDLINGTDNAKQSLKNVKNSWNKSLTKQVFTDPKGAGERVKNGAKKFGSDVKNTASKVGGGVKKAGTKVKGGIKKAGKAIGGLFKKKKRK